MSHENVIKAVRELINVPDDSTFEYVCSKIDAVEQALTAYEKSKREQQLNRATNDLTDEVERLRVNRVETLETLESMSNNYQVINGCYVISKNVLDIFIDHLKSIV